MEDPILIDGFLWMFRFQHGSHFRIDQTKPFFGISLNGGRVGCNSGSGVDNLEVRSCIMRTYPFSQNHWFSGKSPWKETPYWRYTHFPRKNMVMGGKGGWVKPQDTNGLQGWKNHCDPFVFRPYFLRRWGFFSRRWDIIIPAQKIDLWILADNIITYHGVTNHRSVATRLDFAVLSVDWILVIVAWVLAGTEFNSDLFRASRLTAVGGWNTAARVFFLVWISLGFHHPGGFGNNFPKVFAEAWIHQIGMLKNPIGFVQLCFLSIEILHSDWLNCIYRPEASTQHPEASTQHSLWFIYIDPPSISPTIKYSRFSDQQNHPYNGGWRARIETSPAFFLMFW